MRFSSRRRSRLVWSKLSCMRLGLMVNGNVETQKPKCGGEGHLAIGRGWSPWDTASIATTATS